jgi:hypothetical protein
LKVFSIKIVKNVNLASSKPPKILPKKENGGFLKNQKKSGKSFKLLGYFKELPRG